MRNFYNKNANGGNSNEKDGSTSERENRPFNRGYRRINYNRERSFNRNFQVKEHNHIQCGCLHEHSLMQELFCHVPKAILSVCISFLFVVFFSSLLSQNSIAIFHNLFHISHYMHILAASFVAFLSYVNFSANSYLLNILLAGFSSIIFCTLSDVIIPSMMGFVLNSKINMHLCFFDSVDLTNVIIFSACGIICAICVIKNSGSRISESINKMHIAHIICGCFSALFYILSQTSVDLVNNSGLLLIGIFISVVVPCTLSDMIIPTLFGRKNS